MAGAGRLRFGRSGGPAAPVLANVTEIFGAWTTAGRSGRRLNSPTYGLVVSGVPTSYTITQKTGASGIWSGFALNVPVVKPEGVTAITPVPTVTNHTTMAAGGPYTFEIFATGPGGVSNTIIHTINIDPNSVTLGDDGNTALVSAGNLYGVAIGSYGAGTVAPRYVYLGRGITTLGLSLNGIRWAAGYPVVWKDADPAFPSRPSSFNLQNTDYVTIQGFMFTGAWPTAYRVRIAGNISSSNIIIEDCEFGLVPSDLVYNTRGIIGNTAAIDNVIVRNCNFTYIGLCVSPFPSNTNWTVIDCDARYINEGFISIPSMDGLHIENIRCASFTVIPGGIHPDWGQKLDGAITVKNLTIIHVLIMSADSTLGCQGLYFGFTTGAATENLTISGFVYAHWNQNGMRISTNTGVSDVGYVTLVKTNTGDDTNAPVGAKFEVLGPSLTLTSETAGWAGTFLLHDCFAGDNIVMGGVTLPLPTPTIVNCVEADLGVPTPIDDFFLNGNPNVTLPAITPLQWSLMDMDQIEAEYRSALTPGASMPANCGAFDAAGNWRV